MQRPSELFSTVPSALPLLWTEEGKVRSEEVAKVLDFSSGDFARAAQLPSKGFSLKAELPKDVEHRVREWVAVIEEVGRFFEGDVRKTALWFRIPNPLLGNIEPRLMIQYGRAQKLLQIVRSEIAGEVA
jgi:hypothetical protein